MSKCFQIPILTQFMYCLNFLDPEFIEPKRVIIIIMTSVRIFIKSTTKIVSLMKFLSLAHQACGIRLDGRCRGTGQHEWWRICCRYRICSRYRILALSQFKVMAIGVGGVSGVSGAGFAVSHVPHAVVG